MGERVAHRSTSGSVWCLHPSLFRSWIRRCEADHRRRSVCALWRSPRPPRQGSSAVHRASARRSARRTGPGRTGYATSRRLPGDSQLGGHRRVGHAVRAHQHDACPLSQALRGSAPAGPSLECLPLGLREHKRKSRFSCHSSIRALPRSSMPPHANESPDRDTSRRHDDRLWLAAGPRIPISEGGSCEQDPLRSRTDHAYAIGKRSSLNR